jgi:hypothetical protein
MVSSFDHDYSRTGIKTSFYLIVINKSNSSPKLEDFAGHKTKKFKIHQNYQCHHHPENSKK